MNFAPLHPDDELLETWKQVPDHEVRRVIEQDTSRFTRLNELGEEIDVRAIRLRVAKLRGLI